MATDPNKAKMTDSIAIDAQQVKYGLNRTQRAKVYHGQYVKGYRLTVVGNKVTDIAVPAVPAAPTNVVATAGVEEATVSFNPPVQKPGQLPLTFTVTSSPGGITASGGASPIVVPGLTGGTPYTFTVRATNSVGNGANSAASNSVTPEAEEE